MPYLGHHGGMPGGFPAPGMPFVGAPGHWAGNMPGAGEGPGGLHQPGVMRRGHNRNRAGPYDPVAPTVMADSVLCECPICTEPVVVPRPV